MTQLKFLLGVAFLVSPAAVSAWIASSLQEPLLQPSFVASRTRKSNDNDRPTTTTTSEGDMQNPCWEDLYDDDCAMSNVYSASFVASEWIKSMPCAKGLEDCDMPEALKEPATRPEAGVEQVDVMEFLGLKRAAPVIPKNTKTLKP